MKSTSNRVEGPRAPFLCSSRAREGRKVERPPSGTRSVLAQARFSPRSVVTSWASLGVRGVLFAPYPTSGVSSSLAEARRRPQGVPSLRIGRVTRPVARLLRTLASSPSSFVVDLVSSWPSKPCQPPSGSMCACVCVWSSAW